MMGDRTKVWLNALLSATQAITSQLTKGNKSVLGAGQQYPSDEGVYIQIVNDSIVQRGFAKATVRIIVVKIDEQPCYDLISAVSDAIYSQGGSPGRWPVLPSLYSLKVKDITDPVLVVAPEQIGEDRSYSGVLQFDVIGRDIARPL